MEAGNFILYISTNHPASIAAEAMLRNICNEYLEDNCTIKVVDIDKEPDEAEIAGILAIPTLLRTSPAPKIRIIGALSIKSRVLAGLGIVAS